MSSLVPGLNEVAGRQRWRGTPPGVPLHVVGRPVTSVCMTSYPRQLLLVPSNRRRSTTKLLPSSLLLPGHPAAHDFSLALRSVIIRFLITYPSSWVFCSVPLESDVFFRYFDAFRSVLCRVAQLMQALLWCNLPTLYMATLLCCFHL